MRSTTSETYHRRLRKALDLIVRRIDGPCPVEEVAAEAAFSRFHFQRMFRAMTGESVAELVRRLRLERAAFRLRHESVSVIEIAPESLRSGACLEILTDASPPSGISLDSVGGGRYAVHSYRGPYDGISGAYKGLFESWLPGSGEEIDDRPCMEIYRNSPMDTAPADLLSELCLPLRAARNG